MLEEYLERMFLSPLLLGTLDDHMYYRIRSVYTGLTRRGRGEILVLSLTRRVVRSPHSSTMGFSARYVPFLCYE